MKTYIILIFVLQTKLILHRWPRCILLFKTTIQLQFNKCSPHLHQSTKHYNIFNIDNWQTLSSHQYKKLTIFLMLLKVCFFVFLIEKRFYLHHHVKEIKFGNSNHFVCSAIFFAPKAIRLMNYSQYLSLLRQLKWNFTKQRRILSHICIIINFIWKKYYSFNSFFVVLVHSKSIVDTTTVRLNEHRYFTTGELSQVK